MSLAETLAPIWAELSSIKKRLPSVSPATVTSVGPIRIQIDGQGSPVAASPDTLVPVGPGDRVRVFRYGTTHLILGRVDSTPWQPLTLGSNWSNVPSGGPGAQRRKEGDRVWLRGEIVATNRDAGSGRPITTLPPGWRPPGRIRFPWGWGNNITHLHVGADGVIYSGSGAATASPGMFLDAVSFSTTE